MRRDNGYINPLSHAPVVDVADVWPMRVILNFWGVLLDANRGFKHALQYASKCVSQPVVPAHNMTTQPA